MTVEIRRARVRVISVDDDVYGGAVTGGELDLVAVQHVERRNFVVSCRCGGSVGPDENRCFASCSNRQFSLEEPLLISKLRLFFLFVDKEKRDYRGFVIGAHDARDDDVAVLSIRCLRVKPSAVERNADRSTARFATPHGPWLSFVVFDFGGRS